MSTMRLTFFFTWLLQGERAEVVHQMQRTHCTWNFYISFLFEDMRKQWSDSIILQNKKNIAHFCTGVITHAITSG